MILVDTSVWIEHLRKGSSKLSGLLEASRVLIHPFIIGELACGNLKNRNEILQLLEALPQSVQASHKETLTLIEANNLYGRGIGWIDAHLLASALLSRADFWTLDKRLTAVYSSIK